MSTLHGALSAALAKSYEQHATALHQNIHKINKFGELVISPFDLIPHAAPLHNGSVALVAHCPRGRDHAAVLLSLAERGFRVGAPAKHEVQFNDGYTVWVAAVTSIELTFRLVFYTTADAS